MPVLSTSEARRAWWPPCRGPWHEIPLFGQGKVTVRPAITEAVLALNWCLVAANYRTRAQDTGAFVCRQITGGGGYSLHAFGIALDVNWQGNPYGPRLITDFPPAMRAAILGIRTNSGAQVWGWGGNYSGNKDAMHWEIVCSPADIASGIRGYSSSTLVSSPAAAISSTPVTVQVTLPNEDIDMMKFINGTNLGGPHQALFLIGDSMHEVPLTGHALGEAQRQGVPVAQYTESELNDYRREYGRALGPA